MLAIIKRIALSGLVKRTRALEEIEAQRGPALARYVRRRIAKSYYYPRPWTEEEDAALRTWAASRSGLGGTRAELDDISQRFGWVRGYLLTRMEELGLRGRAFR